MSGSPICDSEDAGTAPETSAPSPGSGGDLKAIHPLSAPSSSSPKRSRRSVQKRVVTVPITDADGSRPKGAGEGAPPSDSWAWRKYGQKPIKGSPYPRGYYRCSSSKGCPARKQVERSRTDPTTLVVTYASEHNHPWPLPRNHQRSASASAAAAAAAAAPAASNPSPSHEEDPSPPTHFNPAPSNEKFSDLMLHDNYYWLSDVGSPSTASPPESTGDLLLGSIAASADMALTFPSECEVFGGAGGEEEDSLFAGLGELPECTVVFRRGFLERQMLMQGDDGLAALR